MYELSTRTTPSVPTTVCMGLDKSLKHLRNSNLFAESRISNIHFQRSLHKQINPSIDLAAALSEQVRQALYRKQVPWNSSLGGMEYQSVMASVLKTAQPVINHKLFPICNEHTAFNMSAYPPKKYYIATTDKCVPITNDKIENYSHSALFKKSSLNNFANPKCDSDSLMFYKKNALLKVAPKSPSFIKEQRVAKPANVNTNKSPASNSAHILSKKHSSRTNVDLQNKNSDQQLGAFVSSSLEEAKIRVKRLTITDIQSPRSQNPYKKIYDKPVNRKRYSKEDKKNTTLIDFKQYNTAYQLYCNLHFYNQSSDYINNTHAMQFRHWLNERKSNTQSMLLEPRVTRSQGRIDEIELPRLRKEPRTNPSNQKLIVEDTGFFESLSSDPLARLFASLNSYSQRLLKSTDVPSKDHHKLLTHCLKWSYINPFISTQVQDSKQSIINRLLDTTIPKSIKSKKYVYQEKSNTTNIQVVSQDWIPQNCSQKKPHLDSIKCITKNSFNICSRESKNPYNTVKAAISVPFTVLDDTVYGCPVYETANALCTPLASYSWNPEEKLDSYVSKDTAYIPVLINLKYSDKLHTLRLSKLPNEIFSPYPFLSDHCSLQKYSTPIKTFLLWLQTLQGTTVETDSTDPEKEFIMGSFNNTTFIKTINVPEYLLTEKVQCIDLKLLFHYSNIHRIVSIMKKHISNKEQLPPKGKGWFRKGKGYTYKDPSLYPINKLINSNPNLPKVPPRPKGRPFKYKFPSPTMDNGEIPRKTSDNFVKMPPTKKKYQPPCKLEDVDSEPDSPELSPSNNQSKNSEQSTLIKHQANTKKSSFQSLPSKNQNPSSDFVSLDKSEVAPTNVDLSLSPASDSLCSFKSSLSIIDSLVQESNQLSFTKISSEKKSQCNSFFKKPPSPKFQPPLKINNSEQVSFKTASSPNQTKNNLLGTSPLFESSFKAPENLQSSFTDQIMTDSPKGEVSQQENMTSNIKKLVTVTTSSNEALLQECSTNNISEVKKSSKKSFENSNFTEMSASDTSSNKTTSEGPFKKEPYSEVVSDKESLSTKSCFNSTNINNASKNESSCEGFDDMASLEKIPSQKTSPSKELQSDDNCQNEPKEILNSKVSPTKNSPKNEETLKIINPKSDSQKKFHESIFNEIQCIKNSPKTCNMEVNNLPSPHQPYSIRNVKQKPSMFQINLLSKQLGSYQQPPFNKNFICPKRFSKQFQFPPKFFPKNWSLMPQNFTKSICPTENSSYFLNSTEMFKPHPPSLSVNKARLPLYKPSLQELIPELLKRSPLLVQDFQPILFHGSFQ